VIVGNVELCKKNTVDKLLHDVNAYCAILVTEPGIVMEVRPEQPWNAYLSILVIEFEIIIEVRVVI